MDATGGCSWVGEECARQQPSGGVAGSDPRRPGGQVEAAYGVAQGLLGVDALGRPPPRPGRAAGRRGRPARRRLAGAAALEHLGGVQQRGQGLGRPSVDEARGFSLRLDRLPDLVDRGGVLRPVPRRRSPKTCGLRRCIFSVMPRATSSMVNAPRLLGDHRVEVDLQQQVAELLAQVLASVAGVDRLEGLVGLLEQVARQRPVGLLALPRALGAQPAHHRQELQQRLAGGRWRHPSRQSRQTRWSGRHAA